MTRELAACLGEAAHEAGLELSSAAIDLAARHARLLLEWNRRTNLTRITEPRDVARRHFVESFLAAALLGPAPSGRRLRVLDVGSGGGFPGLAARVVRPDLELTLVEPRAAKAAFLATAAALYPDPRSTVISRRIEDLPRAAGPWDACCFRALQPPLEALLARLTRTARIVFFPALSGPGAVESGLQRAGFFEERRLALLDAARVVVAWRR